MSIQKDKSTICGMLFIGCDRAAATLVVGWSEEQLNDELKRDPEFAFELAEAEGKAELHHMRLVHSATKDEKYWRAATWWLGRRAASRESRAKVNHISTGEIQRFLEGLVDLIFRVVNAEADRDRMAAGLLTAVNATDLENMTRLLDESGVKLPEIKDQETSA